MAERQLDPIVNHNICDSFQGNQVVFLMEVQVKTGDVAGDIMYTARLPGGMVYTSMEVRTAGNTAGLTLDVGWRGTGNHKTVVGVPDVFADGATVAATGRAELLNRSYAMTFAEDRQVDHELMVTLGGTVTAGESVEIKVEGLYVGNM